MDKTIVALFDDFDDAQQAVRELEAAGFRRDDISVVAKDADQRYSRELKTTGTDDERGTKAGSGAATGAVVGGLLGGGGGLLVGLGLLVIPGIGPVIAAGPIAAMLAGAAVGAGAGGLLGALVGLGVPEEEAHTYAEGVRRGGTLVTVKTTDADVDRAVAILERHGPTDVDERRADWQAKGWQRFDETAEPYPAGSALAGDRAGAATAETGRTAARQGETAIPIVEEQVQVGKRQVGGGRVRVHSFVVETPVQEQVTLRDERVHVERRPADRPAEGIPPEALQDRTIEVHERHEEPVVSKTARVTEEVVVGKDVDTRTETVSETVRRTDVEIEDDRTRPASKETKK